MLSSQRFALPYLGLKLSTVGTIVYFLNKQVGKGMPSTCLKASSLELERLTQKGIAVTLLRSLVRATVCVSRFKKKSIQVEIPRTSVMNPEAKQLALFFSKS